MRSGQDKSVILIVEDDAPMGAALSGLFENEGYSAVVKSNGNEALKYNSSDLCGVLLDVHLPDMNGLDVANVLRMKYGPRLPIIMLSGDGSMDVIRQLGDAGADYFFSKPVNPNVLLEYFDTLLQRQ